jgi:D-serine deaminase-like pyridoxal phosphate-dependent protein
MSTWLGRHVSELDTPALVVDLDKLESNITRMQTYANLRGLQYRPHVKTHKVPEIARLQLGAGAVGITAAKIGEAEAMVAGGIKDVFISNQIVGVTKLRRLVKLASVSRLRVGVDNIRQVTELSEAFKDQAEVINVMLEIDTGYERTGVAPDQAAELAQHIVKARGLRLCGVYTYDGATYGATSVVEMASIAKSSRQTLANVARTLSDQLTLEEPLVVSLGSTPSVFADLVHGHDLTVEGVTELRAGNGVFLDAMQASLIGHAEWCAVSVAATVISTPTRTRAVADAGAKAISIDKVPASPMETQGYGLLVAHPNIRVARLNDEHTILEGDTAGETLQIGEVVQGIPNHACPTVNLYDQMFAVRNGRVEKVWQITARGRTQ